MPDQLLTERNSTHGDFSDNATVSQALKLVMFTHLPGAKSRLNVVQIECLEMIALKISRIVSGKADVKDHWDDIAGYATLASREIK